jgi:hypothetical protein
MQTKSIPATQLRVGHTVIGWVNTVQPSSGTRSTPAKVIRVTTCNEFGLVRAEFGKNIVGACFDITDNVIISA